ncbi:hypothetical protein [Embleya sp. AB8]|uniref:hypothetical protein n=1 Tax=Embleya sp. AB8 TaxID=3156304 RepID=UPI003C714ADC
MDSLTSVRWSRTINDVSEGVVTISKAGAPECCGLLGDIEPWVHELSIYRDGDLVWQGPIVRTVEGRRSVRVEARDMIAWLGKLVNTLVLRFVSLNPADPLHAGPVQEIAEAIIRANVNDPDFSTPPDWCRMLPYIVRDDSPVLTKLKKDGKFDSSPWLVYVLKILNDELVPRGLEYTTVGRSVLLGKPQTITDKAQGRLTLEHIAGEVELIKDGPSGASLVWTTNQNQTNLEIGSFGIGGFTDTEYGRLDHLVLSQAEEMDPYDMLQLAWASMIGRFPVPPALSVPTGSQLTTDAPVSIHQLVAGVRLDVEATGMCSNVTVPYRLSDVEVEWGEFGEQVAVSLVPIGTDPPPPIP